MGVELIIGSAERRMNACASVLRLIQPFLAVLNARADGKRLSFHGCADGKKHFKRVPRAVSDRQNHTADRNGFAFPRRVFSFYRRHAPVIHDKPGKTRFKPHVAPEAFDFKADVLDHAGQAVGADVRLGFIKNFLRRSGLEKLVKNISASYVLNAGIEFSVRKRARAAFAELNIAVR